jgi:hypothetical protein
VQEATSKPLDDRFLRLHLDASPSQLRKGAFQAALRIQGLTEQYSRFESESRYQGEARINVARRLGGRSTIWLASQVEGRSYPDSTLRNFHKERLSLGLGSPLGGGRLTVSGSLDWLDYRRTGFFDLRQRSVQFDYNRRLRRRLTLAFLSEFEWSSYGRRAYKVDDPFSTVKQRDRSREGQLRLRYLRRWLFEFSFGWVSVRSNSFGFSVGRRSLEATVSGWLPASLLLQLSGRIESFSYHDANLDEFFIPRVGENLEASQDNNRLIAVLRRRVGSRLSVEGRISWFRNETLLVGDFYEKAVGSIGLAWTPVGASDF